MGATTFGSACVFVPETDERFGQHVQNDEEPGAGCFCNRLYGAPQPWGCTWFQLWRTNVRDVVKRKPVSLSEACACSACLVFCPA